MEGKPWNHAWGQLCARQQRNIEFLSQEILNFSFTASPQTQARPSPGQPGQFSVWRRGLCLDTAG